MKNLKSLVVAGLLIAGIGHVAQAQTAAAPAAAPVATEAVTPPEKAVTDMLEMLMGAIQDDSYTAFMVPMDESVKGMLPKPAFEKVVEAMGTQIKAGYKTRFIDSVKRQGMATYLWKLSFTDKGDQMIVLLTVKDGKAAAFLFL